MAQTIVSSTSERSIHEMLKDTPALNESSGSVTAGSEPNYSIPHSQSMPFPPSTGGSSPHNGASGGGLLKSGASRMDSIKSWSISTYKCTKQLMYEKLGKSSRTVDTELEGRIEQLRDTQRKYANVLRLSRALASHFYHVVQTQHALGEAFSELAQKSPELQEEFLYNSETQRNLTRNGETLLGALNFFTSSVNTLCHKTIEDTLLTIRQYETARIEYDAYRCDLEAASLSATAAPTGPTTNNNTSETVEDLRKQYEAHRQSYEKLKQDVSVKLKFLDENRIKVMHKQLLLFHNAISAYFSGNGAALEATLKQFNIKMKSPNSQGGPASSWLEQS